MPNAQPRGRSHPRGLLHCARRLRLDHPRLAHLPYVQALDTVPDVLMLSAIMP